MKQKMTSAEITLNNKAFSKTLPFLQVAWDSSSLGALKTCARYYFYNIIHGYQRKAENVHLIFGSLLHTALEQYEHQKSAGQLHNEAVKHTVRLMFEMTFDKTIKRPWFSDEPTKNRETLIRTVVWYLDKFERDPMKTVQLANGKAAVELSFRHEIDLSSEITGENYMLCGHLDRVVEWQDAIFGCDHKTTKSGIYQDFFEKFSPDNQMTLYIFSGQVVLELPIKGMVIDGIQVGATFARFQRGVTTRTKSQLEEWYKDLGFWLRQAEVFAEEEHYPMNEKSCSNFGGCPFREVCSVSPESRQSLLDHLYTKRIWDPLTPR
jgi:hypothetical protein